MSAKQVHLILLVPGWKVSALHTKFREMLLMECLRRGVELTVDPEFASGIDLARNISVAKARMVAARPDNADRINVLGMIDGDVVPKVESVFAVLDAMAQGLEIVGGLYPKKYVDWTATGKAAREGVPDEELRYHSGDMVGGAPAGSRRMMRFGKDRFVDADWLGTGFMFMRLDALEKFIAFHSWRTLHRSLWEPTGPQHTVFFSEPQGPRQRARDAMCKMALRYGKHMASIDEMLSAVHKYQCAMADDQPLDVYQTEDFNFVYRAKEAGLGCWMYMDAVLAHQGTFVFEGSMAKRLEHEDKAGKAAE